MFDKPCSRGVEGIGDCRRQDGVLFVDLVLHYSARSIDEDSFRKQNQGAGFYTFENWEVAKYDLKEEISKFLNCTLSDYRDSGKFEGSQSGN